MSQHGASIRWQRGAQTFTDGRYRRAHVWRFDGGVEVPASSSPHVVPLPYSEAAAVDPEEAFVAALSSCHMLWFLSIAHQRGHCVDDYADEAVGVMEPDAAGRLAITRVTLRPAVRFAGTVPPALEEVVAMHEQAHAACFIANSVRTELRCEPRMPD